jgi:hypothetical protein
METEHSTRDEVTETRPAYERPTLVDAGAFADLTRGGLPFLDRERVARKAE